MAVSSSCGTANLAAALHPEDDNKHDELGQEGHRVRPPAIGDLTTDG